MSVYIKGMEMPERCYDCPFLDYEQGYCFATGKKSKLGWYENFIEVGGIKTRHPSCPLVEVPEHGRLIDADLMLNRFVEEVHDMDWVYETIDLPDMLGEMPTVISSDKDGT